MAFFGSMQQQQSLGVGEFIAILRLVSWGELAHITLRNTVAWLTCP